jgi:hypothetical protein
MSIRIATAAAFALMVSPAFADCNQELKALEPAVTTAETGAGTPTTKHQEQVLSGQKDTSSEITGSTTGAVTPGSPHQEQVIGQRTEQSAQHASQLLADARKMAQAGDEQGCMEKVTELKEILGKR